MEAYFRFSAANVYREHVIRQLGARVPAADTAAEFVALASSLTAPNAESTPGWRTDPPFPGVLEPPEKVPNGWRMICASRLFVDGIEAGVIFLTLFSGKPPAVFVAPARTVIPEEYSRAGLR